MLEISLRFLGGEFVAQTPGQTSEWPPHPARLLYALIAAWYDGDCVEIESEALRWLESQDAPAIVACRDAPTETYEAWVPMNSKPTWDKKSGKRPTMPKSQRLRSSRHVGDTPIAFVWDVDIPPPHQSPLRDLCRRCTRLGSAESFVAMTVKRRTDLHGHAWRPSTSGTMLRVAMPGIVDAVAAAETLIPGRVLPCDWRAYRWSTSRRPSRMITVGLAHGSCPVEHAPTLAGQLRRSLIVVAEAEQIPLRPILHGREEDGSPLRRSHLHFCPLPHVGFRHSAGAVLGVSFIVPPNTNESDREYVERVVAAWFAHGAELTMADGRLLTFGPADSRRTLADERWCRAAEVWQSVIPMELPRHVAKRREWNRDDWNRISAEIGRACSQAGLPVPLEVEASNTPFAIGSPNARNVRGPHRRPVVHARVLFPHPVEGPIAEIALTAINGLIPGDSLAAVGVLRALDLADERALLRWRGTQPHFTTNLGIDKIVDRLVDIHKSFGGIWPAEWRYLACRTEQAVRQSARRTPPRVGRTFSIARRGVDFCRRTFGNGFRLGRSRRLQGDLRMVNKSADEGFFVRWSSSHIGWIAQSDKGRQVVPMASSGGTGRTSTPQCYRRQTNRAVGRVALLDGHIRTGIRTRGSAGSACHSFDRRLRLPAGQQAVSLAALARATGLV